jgi:hypothetical protein
MMRVQVGYYPTIRVLVLFHLLMENHGVEGDLLLSLVGSEVIGRLHVDIV